MRTIKTRNLIIGEGRPKICVPLTGGSTAEVLDEAHRAISLPADMIEWRADYFRDVGDPGALTACLRELRTVLGDLPLLFTLRSEVEGGAFQGSGRQYAEIVGTAASSGLVDLVDVELARCGDSADTDYECNEAAQAAGNAGAAGTNGAAETKGATDIVGASGAKGAAEIIGAAHEHGVRVVASYHDFDATPAKDKLIEIFCSMQSHDADILKIAVMPRSPDDALILMDATEEASMLYVDRPVVGISMGELGLISRSKAEAIGSAICFAAGPDGGSAPGQIAAEEMSEILRIMHEHSRD
ncbi:MAG: type I 3-dehydroquinate dehydratase [Mogibacterium sp.]|nr:type I 3-dehydroquinate dehydratase [Mogibacterium sp.]